MRSLTVRYSYPAGESIIDLGLEDGQGEFLGWSGSSRSSVTVGEFSATPGYLMEPVMPGTWHILVRAYHVRPEGVPVRYEISFEPEGPAWLFGDLHLHSDASDGQHDIQTLAKMAKGKGLDFLAITNHNNYSENFSLPHVPGLTLIPGVEWTHYRGHMNFLGISKPFAGSFVANDLAGMRAVTRQARERGALVCVNHESLTYRPLPKNRRWAEVFGCAWFRITGQVPAEAAGRHVVAHIDIGGEGLVYRRQGEKLPVGAVTLDTSYIDRLQACCAKTLVEVGNPVRGGEKIAWDVDAGFNGYYNHPAGRGYFKTAELWMVDEAWLSYYYDYLTVASAMSAQEDPERRAELAAVLDESFAAKDISPEAGRAALKAVLEGTPDAGPEFTAVGHSHLDLAWLWPLRETRRKAVRTFTHQIANMTRYPHYVYGASQPQQFQFVKESHPALYRQLQEFARRGQLECQGGMWVEADCNLPSGESLVRQILWGKQFFRREFGQEMDICWLPDVFGYNGNMPQILKKSGLPYFLTIKLSWNEHNRFPNRTFLWEGIDGSRILIHMPPAETYNAAASPACAAFARDHYPERRETGRALMLYGIGDGGGGPSEVHIEMAQRQTRLQGGPVVRFGRAKDFFHELEGCRDNLPLYRGELYLEKHQGTYTTQARNKRMNRRCEFDLQNLEALCAWAGLEGYPYPYETLEDLWKRVLLLQFHDILPGSSIQRVYTESQEEYARIGEALTREREAVLRWLKPEPGAISAYNPISFPRQVFVKRGGKWLTGRLPSHGTGQLEAWRGEPGTPTEDCLDNGILRIRFAPDGEICSLTELATGQEYAGEFLNRLTLYEDPILPYNAWDIDWEYYKRPFTVLTARESETFCDGPVQIHRAVYRHGDTEILQDVMLYPDSPVVYFKTRCRWQEKLRMLRADFAPAVWSDQVTCDIQFGAIRRSTREDTLPEKAQFEICAHKYVDVSDGVRGQSLLNDCKYGHRVKNGRISLNLLRSPVFPDPEADIGEHTFTYALLPHQGACGAETVAQSYSLNQPPLVVEGVLRPWSMARTTRENVVIDTIKGAQDGQGVVLRLYEAVGKTTVTALHMGFTCCLMECDLMENPIGRVDGEKLTFTPFEIKTLKAVPQPGRKG